MRPAVIGLRRHERPMNIIRALLAAALVCYAGAFLAGTSSAPDKVVTIGFQKYGNLILLKGHGGLDGKLAPLGFRVAWKEFPSGPPLLEALNAGAIDFGLAGETPPIFAQAAGVPLVYLAYEPPAPRVKPSWSPGLADQLPCRSKRQKDRAEQGLQRSLSAGECAGECRPEIYRDPDGILAPADALAAFSAAPSMPGSSGTLSKPRPKPRPARASLRRRHRACRQPSVLFFRRSSSPKAYATAVDAFLEGSPTSTTGRNNIEAVAEQLSPGIGLPASVLEVALKRQSYGVCPINDDGSRAAAHRRHVLRLGLMPKQVSSPVFQKVRTS